MAKVVIWPPAATIDPNFVCAYRIRNAEEPAMSIRYFSASATLLFPLLGVACLHAQGGPNVLTWHNNVSRTGWNDSETILHLTNVNAKRFGKNGFFPADGVVDAQPLYVGGLTIGGKKHNVVFVASEHDSVHAYDPATGGRLWKTSLLKKGGGNYRHQWLQADFARDRHYFDSRH